MLSTEFKRAAEAERMRLVRQRAELTADIDAAIRKIEWALAQHDAASPTAEISATIPGTLASAILKALDKSPEGMRPVEVAKHVSEMGFKVTGTTTMNNRVAGELGRLARIKRLTKTGSGLYKLKESM